VTGKGLSFGLYEGLSKTSPNPIDAITGLSVAAIGMLASVPQCGQQGAIVLTGSIPSSKTFHVLIGHHTPFLPLFLGSWVQWLSRPMSNLPHQPAKL
jgi:hypothetical protein